MFDSRLHGWTINISTQFDDYHGPAQAQGRLSDCTARANAKYELCLYKIDLRLMT